MHNVIAVHQIVTWTRHNIYILHTFSFLQTLCTYHSDPFYWLFCNLWTVGNPKQIFTNLVCSWQIFKYSYIKQQWLHTGWT